MLFFKIFYRFLEAISISSGSPCAAFAFAFAKAPFIFLVYYLCEEVYQDREKLGKFAKENFERLKESFKADGFDLSEEQQKLADFLGLEKKVDVVDILMRFYYCTKREPRFIQTYTENDGSSHSGTGSLFDC